ncbi:hypothetical protein AFCA_011355 [Aspergillus flavus]|nr:hypothetical protein AFCA_011355 [Aspergillus flavus]
MNGGVDKKRLAEGECTQHQARGDSQQEGVQVRAQDGLDNLRNLFDLKDIPIPLSKQWYHPGIEAPAPKSHTLFSSNITVASMQEPDFAQ